jgi:hypothetical protein
MLRTATARSGKATTRKEGEEEQQEDAQSFFLRSSRHTFINAKELIPCLSATQVILG